MSNFIWSTHNPNHATPRELFEELNAEFHFDFDPCPFNPNPQVDGLLMDWGSMTYVNPPYTGVTKWIEKAIAEQRNGKTVVMLLRGDTSTRWFHDLVVPNAEVRFIKGRIKFNGKPAPFPSIIAVFHSSHCHEVHSPHAGCK